MSIVKRDESAPAVFPVLSALKIDNGSGAVAAAGRSATAGDLRVGRAGGRPRGAARLLLDQRAVLLDDQQPDQHRLRRLRRRHHRCTRDPPARRGPARPVGWFRGDVDRRGDGDAQRSLRNRRWRSGGDRGGPARWRAECIRGHGAARQRDHHDPRDAGDLSGSRAVDHAGPVGRRRRLRRAWQCPAAPGHPPALFSVLRDRDPVRVCDEIHPVRQADVRYRVQSRRRGPGRNPLEIG